MQERVLGALIIGGIALVGIVWGVIEGTSSLSRAKKSEKTLETNLKEVVKTYNTENVDVFDCKMVKYKTIEKTVGKRKTVMLFIDISGYTKDNKEFTIGVLTSSNYVLDCSDKFNVMLSNDATDDDKAKEKLQDQERLKKDIYENYTMTSSKLLNRIISDKESSIYKYVIDSKIRYEVRYSEEKGSEGEIIETIKDDKVVEEGTN